LNPTRTQNTFNNKGNLNPTRTQNRSRKRNCQIRY